MHSQTEEPAAELEAYSVEESQPTSFKLYKEYSQKDMTDTIRTRKETREKADQQTREELETEVEIEVENFHIWLEEIKKLEPITAHYCATSLKSLLLGLPTGTQIATLFDTVLNK
jgi:GTPase Era involved in 16S rRNA processing